MPPQFNSENSSSESLACAKHNSQYEGEGKKECQLVIRELESLLSIPDPELQETIPESVEVVVRSSS
jgi:hypothetical protein